MAWITALDLQNSLGTQTYIALFDDSGSGTLGGVNAAAVTVVIAKAHALTVSRISPSAVTLPANLAGGATSGFTTAPDLFVTAELQAAETLAFERKPGYVRSQGELTLQARWTRFESLVSSIAEGESQAVDDLAEAAPSNLGGVTYETTHKTVIGTGPNGTSQNSGDF